MTVPSYDPTFPAHPSRSSWRCAPGALWWALGSLGFLVSNRWLEQALLDADLLIPKYGTRDKSGAALAGWVNRHLGGAGFAADHLVDVSFESIAERAGTTPLIVYGVGWMHWSGVRTFDRERRMLQLANPSPGFVGVYDWLPDTVFELLGPFNLVTLERPAYRRARVTR